MAEEDKSCDGKGESYDEYKFSIVFFEEEAKTQLVPTSWLFRENGENMCRYPPEKHWKYVEQWTRELMPPKKNWQSYPAKLLSKTKTVNKGEKRLKRSYKRPDIASTDGEGHHPEQQPVVFSTKAVKAVLNTVEQMPGSSGINLAPVKNPKKLVHKTHTLSKTTDAASDTISDEDVEVDCELESHDNQDKTTANQGITVRDLQTVVDMIGKKVGRDLEKVKRSILYDLDNKIAEVKHTILTTVANESAAMTNLTEARSGLGVVLPLKDLESFEAFDTSLEDEQKKKALMTLYRVMVAGALKSQECISKIMKATLMKAVEVHYSGTGKKVHGVGKKDFSSTRVYACMQDAILEKFGDSAESNSLPGKVGRWLSGAGDRAGGRKQRQNINADQPA